MESAAQQIESILAAAVEIAGDAERRQFVAQACAGDALLQRRVEELIANHFRAGSFLDSPVPHLAVTATEPIIERPGTLIGPYKLLEQIGEGGFGVVFMAEQTQPVRRKVALKVLKPGMDTRQVVARFEAERQALALMGHPNIAHVFDGGETASGRPYFVMELVRGVPISEFCDQNHLPVRARLELFVSVCQAVQHAHQKGIIHRDLKPSNVLVTLHDDKPVVKVIDFGIAKATGPQLTEKTLFTNFAQMIGTPLYMSPEQAQMSGLDVDTRSDIYSLGVLLYELLTGTTPFDKERLRTAGYDEIRRIIREEEPPKPSTRLSTLGQVASTVSANRQSDPRRLSQLCRGELDWIVMKALEKDRNRRYETASAVAADVERYLQDEPVQACPPSAWYRLRKFARRNRVVLQTASVVALAVLVAVAALAVSTVRTWRANQELRLTAYYQAIPLALQYLSTDNPGRALELLEGCPEDLRQWEWHYLMRLFQAEPSVLRDKTEVNGVAFSRCGEYLASAGRDGAIKVWNSRTRDEVRTIDKAHTGAVVSVAFHPHGKHLASVGTDGKVKVWDLRTDQAVFTEAGDASRRFGAAYTVAFSPDGRQLAAGSEGAVKVWDWRNRQLLYSLPGHDHLAISVAFSPDGRFLATGSWPEGPSLWDATTGQLLRTFPGHRRLPISALAFSPDGGRLASASMDRSVKVWDTTTGERLHTFSHTGNVLCVAFSRDGQRLASAGEDKTVRVWDATTGRELLALRGHTDMCGCLAFSPDGGRLVSASTDKTIRIWDATPLQGDESRQTLTHGKEIRSVAFSPNGRWIASAGFGPDVKVWDAVTGGLNMKLSGDAAIVFCVAWHPKRLRIASADSDGQDRVVKVWDVRTGKVISKLPASRVYFAVAFSPCGEYLVTGTGDGDVQVWNAETGEPVDTLGRHDREIRGVAFSRDGRHLATASGDGVVKLWDATRLGAKREGRHTHTLPTRVCGPSLSVAFSPDGRRLVTAGENNTVKVWDVHKGQELWTREGHTGEVYTVAFSPDDTGRLFASAGEDGTVKVWDSRTEKLVRSFRGHRGLVSSLAFSPDGRRLVSGSRDATVKVWDLTPLVEVPER